MDTVVRQSKFPLEGVLGELSGFDECPGVIDDDSLGKYFRHFVYLKAILNRFDSWELRHELLDVSAAIT